MPISLAPKPVPVTTTELPRAPLVRLREMLGPMLKAVSGTLAAWVVEP
jgi:hypothetical protein